MSFDLSLLLLPLEAVKVMVFSSLTWVLAVLVIEIFKAALAIIFAPD